MAIEDEDPNHIISQLKNVKSLRNTAPVKFADGRATTVPIHYAIRALRNHDQMPNPNSKAQYAKQLHASLSSFKQAVGLQEDQEFMTEDELNEVSKQLLGRYINKAIKNGMENHPALGHDGKKYNKRQQGIATAGIKYDARDEPNPHVKRAATNEEVELDEVSKGLLNRYVAKAKVDQMGIAHAKRQARNEDDYEHYDKMRKADHKRHDGITVASQKLGNTPVGLKKVTPKQMATEEQDFQESYSNKTEKTPAGIMTFVNHHDKQIGAVAGKGYGYYSAVHYDSKKKKSFNGNNMAGDAHGAAVRWIAKQHSDHHKLNEEVELDEISNNTLRSYVGHAGVASREAIRDSKVTKMLGYDKESKHFDGVVAKRAKGINKAIDKLHAAGCTRFRKEEVELDEVSRGLLKNYVKRAGEDYDRQDSETRDLSPFDRHDAQKKMRNREKGTDLAHRKIGEFKWGAKVAAHEETELTESTQLLDKHIEAFSKGIKSSKSEHARYKQGNAPIHNVKHVKTDASHQDVFNHLHKLGYRAGSGYGKSQDKWDTHTNHESMTTRSDPIHHKEHKISAHIEQEHGGKTHVHFHHHSMNEETELTEITHRDFGAAGKMHPSMAKSMKVGEHNDFYQHETGNKAYGKVTKNDGVNIHLKTGTTTHKFQVANHVNGQKMNEEDLNEVSKSLLHRYIRGASNDMHSKGYEASSIDHKHGHSYSDAHNDESDKARKKSWKRSIGVQSASHKLAFGKYHSQATAADYAKEEVDELDEVSIDKLNSYKEKATKDYAKHKANYGAAHARGDHDKDAHWNKAQNRLKGIGQAGAKIHRHEYKELNHDSDEMMAGRMHPDDFRKKHLNKEETEMNESIKPGYHVVGSPGYNHEHPDKSDYAERSVGHHKDSSGATSHAARLERKTGRVHTIHHVGQDGKIKKSWSSEEWGYKPHTDFKGEHAHHLFREETELDLEEKTKFPDEGGDDRSYKKYISKNRRQERSRKGAEKFANLKYTDKHEEVDLSELSEDEIDAILVMIDEDEELNEISKSTLSSYVKKATRDYGRHALKAGYAENGANRNPELYSKFEKHLKHTDKRAAGIDKAVGKLAKESVTQSADTKIFMETVAPGLKSAMAVLNQGRDVIAEAAIHDFAASLGGDQEQITEVSKQLLGRYVNKARADIGRAEFNYDNSGKLQDPDMKRKAKREEGIDKARKLAKEDVNESSVSSHFEKISHKQIGQHLKDHAKEVGGDYNHEQNYGSSHYHGIVTKGTNVKSGHNPRYGIGLHHSEDESGHSYHVKDTDGEEATFKNADHALTFTKSLASKNSERLKSK